MVIPPIVPIYICLSPLLVIVIWIPLLYLMINAKRKKDPPAGKLDPTLCPQKMERGIDVFFESGVGTDGARTRNFRLDRAVL
jgi:hypothetical protein